MVLLLLIFMIVLFFISDIYLTISIYHTFQKNPHSCCNLGSIILYCIHLASTGKQ